MVSIGVPVSIGSVASISVGVAIAIGQPWFSLSLRLGLWLTGHEGGKANLEEYLYFKSRSVGQLVVSSYHKSELHCCLSVQFRMIPERRRAQFIAPQSPQSGRRQDFWHLDLRWWLWRPGGDAYRKLCPTGQSVLES